jgi:alpha/beta superfamily hydrolase
MYKMIYNTVDAQGDPTIASGAFLVPTNTTCLDFPVAVYHHGTSLRKTDVPSYNVQETLIGKVFAAGGYFTCMPDYIGMGESPGLHPYVHGESEATASIDMIRAAREFISDSLSMIDNGEVFLTGYSQGGHACMATHKYINDNNMSNEFDVIASAPCSGPYVLSITMADSLTSLTPYSNPGYIVYLLASYELVYGNIFNSWSDVLKSPYDTIVPPFFDGNNTTLGMGQLNSLIPQVMDSLIVDSVLTNFINDSVNKTHPLWVALLANDNYDWTPQEPVNMYYCTADEQVAYTNSLVADSVMNLNGAPYVQSINSGSGLNHNACVFPALSTALNWFQSIKDPCSASSDMQFGKTPIKLYPNPINDEFKLEVPEAGQLSIYSTDGKLVFQQHISTKSVVYTNGWLSGLYLIKFDSPNSNYRSIVSKI